jgi:hypothetical protein
VEDSRRMLEITVIGRFENVFETLNFGNCWSDMKASAEGNIICRNSFWSCCKYLLKTTLYMWESTTYFLPILVLQNEQIVSGQTKQYDLDLRDCVGCLALCN